jgi:hypothetical protein
LPKLFTDLVVSGAGMPVAEIVISVILFALLFATTRIANYLQKTYRVKFFDKAFGADERQKTANTESWEWAMALELVNVLVVPNANVRNCRLLLFSKPRLCSYQPRLHFDRAAGNGRAVR